ncbi:hypothetical protein ACFE04_027473 [Oxalis oulophora]
MVASIYLCDGGWKDLVESHSLAFDHFIIFRCESPWKFNVVICDTTAVEIEYPLVYPDLKTNMNVNGIESIRFTSPRSRVTCLKIDESKVVEHASKALMDFLYTRLVYHGISEKNDVKVHRRVEIRCDEVETCCE